jgi:hypothetical protein
MFWELILKSPNAIYLGTWVVYVNVLHVGIIFMSKLLFSKIKGLEDPKASLKEVGKFYMKGLKIKKKITSYSLQINKRTSPKNLKRDMIFSNVALPTLKQRPQAPS